MELLTRDQSRSRNSDYLRKREAGLPAGQPEDHSILSRGSYRSILSYASTGSILSIGSAGSILSIGSAGSILSIFSAGSILSLLCAGSLLSFLRYRAVRGQELPVGKPLQERLRTAAVLDPVSSGV